MRRWPGRRKVAALLGVFLLLVTAIPAVASEAAVIVRHGDGSMTYAVVAFPEEEISSFNLLERTGLSLTTVEFGGLGEAVCTLDGEGCGMSDCRQRLCQSGDPESPFWQFFRPGADGNWVSQPLGASNAKVHDGDIDVWSWTGSEANVPPLGLADVAAQVGVDLSGDSEEPAVHTATFDAAGNRIVVADGTGADPVQIVLGVAALLILAAGAVLIARRRNARLREKS